MSNREKSNFGMLLGRRNAWIQAMKRLRRPVMVAVTLTTVIAFLALVVAVSYWQEVTQITLNRALVSATDEGNIATVSRLLQQGADPNSRRIPDRKDASWRDIFKRMIDRFYRSKAATSTDGRTVLLYAVQSGRADIVEALLERGADPNAIGVDDKLPIYWSNRSPLGLAVILGYPKISSMLLNHGARPDARDEYGMTPLAIAVLLYLQLDEKLPPKPQFAGYPNAFILGWFRTVRDDEREAFERTHGDHTEFLKSMCLESIRLLVQKHASHDIKDATGMSAMDYARTAQNRKLEEILRGDLLDTER